MPKTPKVPKALPSLTVRKPPNPRIKLTGYNPNNDSGDSGNDPNYVPSGNENTNMESVVSEEGIIEADVVNPFSPEVLANFEQILQLKEGQAEDTIKYFKNGYEHSKLVHIPEVRLPPGVILPPNSSASSDRFYPLSGFIYNSSLPGVKFESNSDPVWPSKITVNSTVIPLRKIGRGSYGNIFQDATGVVYKQTQLRLYAGNDLELKCEEFYREFLLEAFIQVVLQNANPDAVGQISGIYIDDRINRRISSRATNSPNAILEVDIHPRLPTQKGVYDDNMAYSCFIKMSLIPYTFDSYAKTKPSGQISLAEVKRIFITLSNNLERFLVFGFKHRDLHMGNLMFNISGNPIIIDFGRSCIKIHTDIYSVKMGNCESYDLLMLMASLYQFHNGIFEDNALQAIGDCMKMNPTDSRSVYNMGRLRRDQGFHAFYTIIRGSDLEKKIPPRLKPENIGEFRTYWTEYKPPSLVTRGVRCIGAYCQPSSSNRRRKSKGRKTKKLRKTP